MAKKAAGKDLAKESLAKELKSLIPKLDSPGLAFLVEQARVHLYNMQVDKLNKAAQAANVASARTKSIAGKAGKESSKGVGENLKIGGTDSGSSYYIYYRNSNVMFSRGEMTHLVKIANGKGADSEIRERLYNWFERERKDIFALIPMANKNDPRLKTIITVIKKNFKLRDT